jgi:DNA polymerase-3 subunit gamma/tau
LSLLDQAIAFGGGVVQETEVRTMLGSIERGQIYAILRALAQQDGAELLAQVAQLAELAPDFGAVLVELLSLLQRVAVAQTVPDAIDDSFGDRDTVLELAQALSPEDVQLYYQIALIGRRDLPLSPDARGGLEMVLLRMLAFRPDSGDVQPASTAPARTSAAARTASSGRPATAVKAAVQTAVKPVAAAPIEHAATPVAAVAPRTTPPSGDWPALIDALQLRGMVRQLAENCTLAEQAESLVHLRLDPAHEHLNSPALEKKLAEALNAQFGREIKLRIDAEAASEETPAQTQARLVRERQQAAERSIAEDDNIRNLEETFGAQVQRDTVRPVD